jgi:hypothetical protein
MMESDWDDYLGKHSIRYPFDGSLKAIEVDEDDVDSELLKECVNNYVISEVSKGYFVTHEDIERHLEVINEHGMEAYLEKRLEVFNDQ